MCNEKRCEDICIECQGDYLAAWNNLYGRLQTGYQCDFVGEETKKVLRVVLNLMIAYEDTYVNG